jgi:hypothetical protein
MLEKLTKGEFIMKMKTLLIASIFVIMSFAAGVFVQKSWGEYPESFTRTLYNNKVPYNTFFTQYSTNKIKVQKGSKQIIIPVVNDEKKDLTKEVKKGS